MEYLNVRVPSELIRKIDAAVERLRREDPVASKSSVVRRALTRFVDEVATAAPTAK